MMQLEKYNQLSFKESNYYKGWMATKYLRDGLEITVDDMLLRFHTDILSEICVKLGLSEAKCTSCKTANCLPCPTEGVCGLHGASSTRCPYHLIFIYRPCPNRICDQIYEIITSQHRYRKPTWIYTDATQWCTYHWEIAKCFLPGSGYANTRSVKDLDLNGLLYLAINFRDAQSHFDASIDPPTGILSKVLKYRNNIVHSASYSLSQEELGLYTDLMIRVLQDKKELAQDHTAKKYVAKLKELKDEKFLLSNCEKTEIQLEQKESDRKKMIPNTSKLSKDTLYESVTRQRYIDNSKDLYDMCVLHGRKSQEVVEACKHICMKILVCSRSFKDVWPTYKPTDPDNIVFIVVCEPESNASAELSKSVRGFQIKFCTIGEYRNEEKELSAKSHLFSETEQADQKNLTDILRKTSSHFMQEHSNLNIISASPFKSRGYALSKHRVERKPCIVFYVRLKGYIPIQEDALLCALGCYATDVREGAFALFNTPEPFIQRLKIGCSIGEDLSSGLFGGKGGTLGAFVDLGHGKVGCITSAHALYSERQLHYCEDKKKIDNINDADTVYQPAPSPIGNIPGNKPFGRVESVVYKTGRDGGTGVEAALVSITDQTRYPEDGRFPKIAEDFTTTNQLNYMSGHIMHGLSEDTSQYTFFKYGATTELTRGAFHLHASAVRTNGKLDVWGNCKLHNQIEVVSLGEKPFAKPGDSGALVLLSQNNDLHAVGIVTGGTLDYTKFYVTPIWEVLKALGLPLKLKHFHAHSTMETDNNSNENASFPSNMGDAISFEEVKSSLDKEIKTLSHTANTKFENVGTKIGNMKTKIDNVETKVDNVDTKVGHMETKVGNIETKIDNMESKVGNVETKVDNISSGINEILNKMNDNGDREGPGRKKKFKKK